MNYDLVPRSCFARFDPLPTKNAISTRGVLNAAASRGDVDFQILKGLPTTFVQKQAATNVVRHSVR